MNEVGPTLTVTYWFSRYDGQSWTTPEAVVTIPYDSYAGLMGRFTAQPDGHRFALVFQGDDRKQWLMVRGTDGTWLKALLYPRWNYRLGIAFTAANKLQVILQGEDMAGPDSTWEKFFYTEQ